MEFCGRELLETVAVIDWIVERYDWFIYRLSMGPMERMCQRNGGFAYLFELHIREWRRRNPIPEKLERATERFFEEIYRD